MKDKVTREDVVKYISKWLGVPLSQLTDETVVGHRQDLATVCCFTFGKTVIVSDARTFTLGHRFCVLSAVSLICFSFNMFLYFTSTKYTSLLSCDTKAKSGALRIVSKTCLSSAR